MNEPQITLEQMALRKRLSDNLKKFRHRLRVSQEGLADLAGLHRTYVSQVERMVTNISLDNIYLLARALECDPAELLAKNEDDDGSQEPAPAAVAKKSGRRASPK
ncbi:helix-turn-helix domain-containing protein [Paraburkholderia sp. CNPSo 3157]|uniref:Helix-turn-helix domain-containing protein n=1 Tax=Paraburkholderia franconis TaxID=2654983 RepID=A0A7X1TH03_9BURK|nr:helix-turn-helix transcriptional regulator [Paraburkholderia franconis]MPW18928.1 helix-turn-helix domain-containing protein [Paraburkholderia franconis]